MLHVLTVIDHITSGFLVALHVAVASMLWMRRGNNGLLTEKFTLGCCIYALSVGAVFLIWSTQNRTVTDFGLGLPSSMKSQTGLGIALLCICFSWWAARQARLDSTACQACRHEYLSRLTWPMWGYNKPVPVYGMFFSAAAGAAEEIVFRGWFVWYFANLAEDLFALSPSRDSHELASLSWSALWSAVVLSSAVFALVHAPSRRAKLVCFSLFIGLIAGASLIWTHSLWPALILHASHNAAMAHLGLHLSRMPLPSPGAAHLEDE